MGLNNIWHSYTAQERRNIAFYIAGLMSYKLSFEIWTGSLTTIALTRFHNINNDDEDSVDENTPVGMLGALQSLNLVFQCLGAVIVAWGLRLGWSTRGILIWTVLGGALISGGLLGLDTGTGGRWKGFRIEGEEFYGNWDARILVLVFALAGVVAGGVELVRKVVPRAILGVEFEEGEGEGGMKKSVERMGNKLRRMDAMVHIFYELAGTAGAFLSADLNLRLGSNFAVVVVPGVWILACIIWLGMRVTGEIGDKISESPSGEQMNDKKTKRTFWRKIWRAFISFFTTLQLGTRLIFSTPQYAWLPLGYSLSLYAHRYLENGLAPAIAKYVYNESAYYQIIVGGSNLGELIGALAVFLLTEIIQSPLPWVRLDAAALAIIWVVVKWRPPIDENTGKVPVVWAWKLAVVFLPISLGWAAGDVSLVAHIQTTLSSGPAGGKDVDDGEKNILVAKSKQDSISSLGAVMAVLYSTYIALFALLNPLLGIYIDRAVNSHKHKEIVAAAGERDGREGIWEALVNVGGIQFSVIAVLVGVSTLVPLLEDWPWGRKMGEGKEKGGEEGRDGEVVGEVEKE